MTWNDALDAYRTAQRAAGRSPGTIRLHRHYLNLLAGHTRSPHTVTTATLQQLLANETWAPETRKSARSAFRGFYRWAYGSGLVDDDPAFGLATVRVPPAPPRPTPEHLVRRLVAAEDRRVAFMVMLAALGGLRCAEIAQVHSDDLDADVLLVHGKGGKVRPVPIVSARLLDRLLGVSGWAFPNGHGSHLSPGHVSRLLSAALPDHWTGHTLRHRCATVAYAGSRDLLAVGAFLGHSRPETTQRYVRMPDDAIRAALRAATLSA